MAPPATEHESDDETEPRGQKRPRDDLDSEEDDSDGEEAPDINGNLQALVATPVANNSPNTPASRRRRITRHGELKYIAVMARRGVASPTPVPLDYDGPDNFLLYLPSKPTHKGAEKFIECTPDVLSLSARHGTTVQYAKHISPTFRHHHGKALTQLNRALRLLAFGPGSAHSIAENAMDRETGEMSLSPRMRHLQTTTALRELLLSDSLYADQAMYVNWRNLLASGKLLGMTRQSTAKPLPELVSVNYEAHFRCELAAALQYQGHRHCSLDSAKRDRANNFVQVRRCVRKDRRDNLQAAEDLRIGTVETEWDVGSEANPLMSGGIPDDSGDESAAQF